MFDLGIFNYNFKKWTITSKQKAGKRKKYYVCEDDYRKYLLRKAEK